MSIYREGEGGVEPSFHIILNEFSRIDEIPYENRKKGNRTVIGTAGVGKLPRRKGFKRSI